MSDSEPKNDQQPEQKPDPNTIRIEPGTLVLIIVVLLLIPLLLAGFGSQ